MSVVPAKVENVYNFLLHDLADPRTKNWFLIENPFHVILIIALYVSFVTKWGPEMMKNRKPFHLKKIMIVYNIFQILSNTILFVEGFRYAYGPFGLYSFWCEPVDTSDSAVALYAAKCFYTYYLIKIIDLLDTVFMVLRKKQSHVTFLHVYHHAGMVPLSWAAVNYYPGGHGAFLGIFNAFVHAVMYSYYLLAAISPQQERYKLGWKKYLTLLQLVQFFVVGLHMTLPLFQPKCSYPKFISFFITPNVVFMVLLFTDFYVKAYIKTKAPRMNGTLEPKSNGAIKFDENKNKIR